jgi:hypothetical protein
MGLVATITQAGMRAILNAQQNGLKVSIASVGVGDRAYTPSDNLTRLYNEQERVPILSSEVNTDEKSITVHAILQSNKQYWIREVGFYLDDGTLFAVWSDQNYILGYKTDISQFLIGFKMKITTVPISSIQIINQGVDLNLFYAEEFIQFADSITNLGYSILDIKNQLDDFKSNVKSQFLQTQQNIDSVNIDLQSFRYLQQEANLSMLDALTQIGYAVVSNKLNGGN